MKRPLISIATPCWNSVATIERTIKSVLEQDFTDYQYIIVDGGSTDGTIDVIKKYEPLFNGRMSWRSERDKGLYDAFNKGVNRSDGVYCWNVNADDYLEPNALRQLANYIKTLGTENLPVISGGMNFISIKGEIMSTLFSNEKILKKGFKNDFIGVPHPATLVPKEMYVKHGTFDTYYKIIGDADWFHRVYAAGEKFVFLDFIITNMSDGGVSSLYNYRRSLRDRLYFLRKYYPNPVVRLIHLFKWTFYFYIRKYAHQRRIENEG